jgi:hypothetical protein
MLTAKQIEAIISDAIGNDDGNTSPASIAAQKIHDLCKPDHTIHVSAAMLENEYTDVLINMLLVTVLGTLIDQEGGGRTNITISPALMSKMMAEWNHTVEMNGLERTVRITPARPEEWEATEESPADAKLGSLIAGFGPVVDSDKALPQAEPHEYKRPLWVVAATFEETGALTFYRAHDRSGAERELRSWDAAQALASNAHIENRWCLHPECPSTGCNHDPSQRDTPEATSDAD